MPMSEQSGRTGFLSPYRALDLTDHRGALAGHMLAQMGCDVIALEPPEGSRARREPPFAPDWPEGENSMFWAAYASGKRSVVCDPNTAEGLALFHQLVARVDFLFESAAPAEGRPDWLDPATLAAVNPRLIHVTITPFGLGGPKQDWADSELIMWAAGGPLLATRTLDDVPVRISAPQSYLHAAGDAAGGALIALFARHQTGRGQHVDISVQQSVPETTLTAVLSAALGHDDFTPRPPKPGEEPAGGLDLSGSGARTRRSKWLLADGMGEMHLAMGPNAGASTNALFAWMRREGALEERFWDWDWSSLHHRVRAEEITDEDMEAARQNVGRFLSTRTKAEMVDVAMEIGVRIAPIQTVADLVESPQCAARGFFQRLDGPFGSYIAPGDFAMGAPGGFVPLTPAPKLGEHTDEVLAELSEAAR